ncbi:TonB-dependent siderophore receptor [Achromobacter sp. Marseille-Q0513]|uniref:TonB-dependent receptor n=1 Tax=Achromobacter sp. Marseille-Q0513 TaxID=2829161 RepID=UPI001B91D470|nr:TonB-dependent siderophore receptor [Achromobacter sp. Marseille-Q0513]MBR8653347.1 TonB-dependent siderophore receptor [Achromobacter sp. Marseille-Q0513]
MSIQERFSVLQRAGSVSNSIYAAVCGALAAPGLALAQGATHELSPVHVSGQAVNDGYEANVASSPKMTAPLLDTPRSVTVITEQLMRDRAATSLMDVLRTAPGITFGAGEGGTPTGDRPFIRGYEASTDLMVDGMRDLGRFSHETFNIESVEILKGPSSAYSGRGSTGGSINLVSKSPKAETFAEASTGFGTDNNWRLTGDANVAFSDTAAFRLNVMKQGGDVPGRDHVKTDRWGAAPSIAWGLGTPTRVTLSYYHLQNDDTPDLGIPFKNESRPGRVTPPRVDRDNYYGIVGRDYRKNQADMGTLRIEHQFSDAATLRNSTRYSESRNEYVMTRPSFDNCAAPTGSRPNPAYGKAPCSTEANGLKISKALRTLNQTNRSFANQTDLFGEFAAGGLRHSYVAGVEFSREEITKRDGISSGGFDKTLLDDLYRPNPHQAYTGSLSWGPSYRAAKTNTAAAYVFDTIKFSEQWETSVGLRYDRYRVESGGAKRTDGLWNYQLGLVYKPAPNGSIYVSYGTSSNPSGETAGQSGGADGAAGGRLTASTADLGPEKSRSIEIGTKWNVFDDRLSLTAALFETRKTDARSSDPLTGDITLAGSNRVRGIELGAAGSITPKWQVWAGYSYLDPKISSYRSGKEDFSGKQMKFIARQSASLWTTYKFLPELTTGIGATYTGKRYVDDANVYQLPSYWRYDAMASYAFNKNFSLQLNLNNLTNETIYEASHVGLFSYVAPGRSAMLTATFRYN